jgi:hypothetical protein
MEAEEDQGEAKSKEIIQNHGQHIVIISNLWYNVKALGI